MQPRNTITVHRCPVCWRTVQKTMKNGNIMGHYDKARHYCPGSFADWAIIITDEAPRIGIKRPR